MVSVSHEARFYSDQLVCEGGGLHLSGVRSDVLRVICVCVSIKQYTVSYFVTVIRVQYSNVLHTILKSTHVLDPWFYPFSGDRQKTCSFNERELCVCERPSPPYRPSPSLWLLFIEIKVPTYEKTESSVGSTHTSSLSGIRIRDEDCRRSSETSHCPFRCKPGMNLHRTKDHSITFIFLFLPLT